MTEAIPKEIPFEKLLLELDKTVSQLEKGDLPLEKSLQLYEAGIGLVRAAEQRLDHLEKRIEELMQDGTRKEIA